MGTPLAPPPSGEEKPEKKAEEALKRATKILEDYNYKQPDIPYTSVYWTYMNVYRKFAEEAKDASI